MSIAELDRAVLLGLRERGDRDDPLGPDWVQQMATDITSLGSYTVLTLLVLVGATCLLLDGRRATAWLLLGSAVSATLLSTGIKALIDRSRPDLVLHLVNVSSPSFPSGHALLSATIYLTLGAVLARQFPRPALRRLFLGVAITLALLVGASRVYLGVHWPSDVLAGWIIGAAWAWGCWLLAAHLASRAAAR